MSLFKKIAGVILIGIGIIALLTPLTPGSWLFLLGGIALLGTEIDLTEDGHINRWGKRFGVKIDDREDSNIGKWAKRFGIKLKRKIKE